MTSDSRRKANIIRAIERAQRHFDLLSIYSTGMATILQEWLDDTDITSDEIKAIMQEQGTEPIGKEAGK